MTHLTFRNGISIAILVIYSPLLLTAAFLSKRHGFGRSSGWIFLVLFTMLRILSGAFNLALISSPSSIGLHVAYGITNFVGISALLLASLGLLNRAIESIIRQASSVIVQPRHLRFIQMCVMVGLILAIVGGVDANDAKDEHSLHNAQTLTEASVGLFLAGFLILAAATAATFFSISAAEPGERRLIPAVAAALPFLLVRVVYSAAGAWGKDSKFNSATGDNVAFLIMVVIMELVVVLIFVGVGLTLRAIPKEERGKIGDFMELSSRRGLVGKLVGGGGYQPAKTAPAVETTYGQTRHGA